MECGCGINRNVRHNKEGMDEDRREQNTREDGTSRIQYKESIEAWAVQGPWMIASEENGACGKRCEEEEEKDMVTM